MKFTKLPLIALALSWAVGSPVRAELCTIDVVPAQTLLLPYFQVDLKKLGNPRKAEVTTIHITNVASDREEPVTLNVIVWTDLGVPTVAWEISLERWASIDIPVHEIFRGEPPGLAEGDDTDGLGTDGAALRAAHSGKPVEPWDGECAGQDLDGKYARGYITIDVVGEGKIWGEVSFLSQKGKHAQTVPLAHVETDRSGNHEPLASTWGVRYSKASKDQTFLVVWRDAAFGGRYTCGNIEELDWYPLEQVQIVAFDAEANFMELGRDTPVFPAATGLYKVGVGELSFPFRNGWIYLNLNVGAEILSSWVETLQYVGSGRRRGRNQGLMFTSACDN